eukprot:g65185.t1
MGGFGRYCSSRCWQLLLLCSALFLLASAIVLLLDKSLAGLFLDPRVPDLAATTLISIKTTPRRPMWMLVATVRSLLHQDVHTRLLICCEVEDYLSTLRHHLFAAFGADSQRIELTLAPSSWLASAKLLCGLRHINQTGHRYKMLAYADDDMIYPPSWLPSLLTATLQLPHAAVGGRGWRIPSRLPINYGVSGNAPWPMIDEVNRYVVEGFELRKPYRVHCFTGSAGVLVRPSFFDEHVFDVTTGPLAASLLDDQWIAGHLARTKTPRYVVPLPESHTHLASGKSVIDPVIANLTAGQYSSRADLASAIIRYFEQDWEKGMFYARFNHSQEPSYKLWIAIRYWLDDLLFHYHQYFQTKAYKLYMMSLNVR